MLQFTGHLSMYIIYLHVTVKAVVWPGSKCMRWHGYCGSYSTPCARCPVWPGRTLPGLSYISLCVRCSLLWLPLGVTSRFPTITGTVQLMVAYIDTGPTHIHHHLFPVKSWILVTQNLALRIQEEDNTAIISQHRCQRKPSQNRNKQINRIYLRF